MRKQFSVSKRISFVTSLLSAAGFLVALYLAWLHYQVHTNPAFHSFCAMSDSFNCETVAESPYSVLLNLPIAVWGMLGYVLMFFLSAIGIGRYQLSYAYLALLTASLMSVLASIILAIVSHCIICSFCLMCCVTYAINIIMFATLSWQALKQRFPFREATADLFLCLRRHWCRVLIPALLVLLTCLLFPSYWVHPQVLHVQKQVQGKTLEGHHWTGGDSAALEIVEFSDYLCPHCRRAHKYQRALVSSNSTTLRLVHRHFPLDDACNSLLKTPFHPGACVLARAAICAGQQERFWEMNDLLYNAETLIGENWEAKVEYAARQAGLDVSLLRECLASDEARNKLDQDIAEGLRLDLRGTPSFIVNGKIHLGVVDPSILQEYGIFQHMK